MTKKFSSPLTPTQLTQITNLFNLLAPPTETDQPPILPAKHLTFLLRTLGLTPTESEILDIINECESVPPRPPSSTSTSASTSTVNTARTNIVVQERGLSLNDFIALMSKSMEGEMGRGEEINQCFDSLAKSGSKKDGVIGENEMMKGLNSLGLDPYVVKLDSKSSSRSGSKNPKKEVDGGIVRIEEVEEMVKEADVEGLGGVGREDFKLMMENRHREMK